MTDLAKRLARLSPEKRALLERQMQDRQRSARPKVAPIAVIGIGCRFPGGGDTPGDFWDMLVNGVDAIREVPANRWDADELYDPDATVRGKMATRWGGFLDDIELFDPPFFELTDREAARMDPQQRIFLETAWAALEDAGLVASELAGSSTGVFVAAHNLNSDYFIRQTYALGDIDGYSATGGAHSIVANRVSYWLDLQGPSLTVDTACSGSLVAAHLAVNSLRAAECDVAIAGGVNLMLCPETSVALSGLQMMASDGRCKTFDARADGFVRGEGCGAVILKPLEDAERDGDAVYAVIRGSAINQDGRTNGLTAPNGLSQQRVLRQALKQAGVDPSRVGYVEAHGTGTAMGDPIEVEALTEVMGRGGEDTRCVLGSVKTNIGHLESAAGIAGLIKSVLCLHHHYIPPNLHFTTLNPHIDLSGTRFDLPTEGAPWRAGDRPRVAGVSSFGFGGTNAHMVLEEAPHHVAIVEDEALPAADSMLLLSARDQGALDAIAASCSEILSGGELSYRDVCYTAACRRTHHEHRIAVFGTTAEEAAQVLQSYLKGDMPPELIESRVPGRGARRMCWVFSGQGSQRVGMGVALLDSEPVFRQAIERIDELLSCLAGWSLLAELRSADDERLSQTEIAQPAIFAIEVGLAAMLRHYGVEPDAVVGHSLGEVAAAHIAGALSLEDAVTVIFHRGRLMQSLHGAGRMAAVSASKQEVAALLGAKHEGVSIAAVNGPRSVTVSGAPDAIERFVEILEVPHQLLPVKYAFHSAQMERLQDELKVAIAGIRVSEPTIAAYSTVRGGLAERGDFGPDYWAMNIRESVDFAGAIAATAAAGADCFVEVGPQAVLGPAIEQCLETGDEQPRVLGALLRNRPESAIDILAALHVNGLSVAWPAYFRDVGQAVHLPTYRWQRRRCWFDPSQERFSTTVSKSDVDDWGYEVAWPLRTPLQGWIKRLSLGDQPALATVSSSVAAQRDETYRRHGAEDSRELVVALESLAVGYASRALRELGFAIEKGDTYSTEDVLASIDGYGVRIVARLFRLLEGHGVVSEAANGWTVLGEPSEVGKTPASVQDKPAAAEVLALLERCGRQVASVVRGKTDPLSLLFPGDYSTSAEWVYADAPFSRVANDLVGETVSALTEGLADSRSLRVLEIGAGTGGTTRTVLPRLPSNRTEYVFTDLSQSFLKQATERFGDNLSIHCEILDVEIDPAEQGFAPGQFDLIIAANVIHATADLRTSLRHALELLVPGGTLLLLEGTARRGWIDLTFGLTEGWWRFTDTDIRTDHPLLGVEAWRNVLTDTGFAEVTAIPVECDSAGSLFEQAILLARAPTDRGTDSAADTVPSVPSAPWIVFADSEGVGEAIAEQLRSVGTTCITVHKRSDKASGSRKGHQVNAASPEDFVHVLARIAEEHGTSPEAVVHLFAADERAEPGSAEEWDESMTRSCGSLLHLLQAMEATGLQPERGVWAATCGAQPVVHAGRRISVAQAPLWGLGRVAAREKPELWGGLVDFDNHADAGRNAAALRAIICADHDENQFVLRSGDRFVARLVERPIGSAAPTRVRDDRSYLIVGGLGGIGLQVAQWMVQRGAKHLTLTSRRGMPDASDSQAADIVRDLEAAGTTITVLAADTSDAARMKEVFGGFDTDRPALAGVIHTAAAIEFLPLEGIALDSLLSALRAKVSGSWVLHELTAGLDLDFMLLFSSMAAIGGFPQLGHYAAANCFMDALAHRRRELGLPALSINWGLWSEGRSTSEANSRLFENIGLRAMPSTSALEGLERVLAGDPTQTTIAWVDWETFRPIYESRGARSFLSRLSNKAERSSPATHGTERPRTSALLTQLRDADREGATRLLESAISNEVATILGVTVNELPGRSEGFFQMGMDSIMTVELRRRLEKQLQADLPTTLAFEYSSIERLTEFLADEVLGVGGEADAARTDARESAPVEDEQDDLDAFSDEELAAALDRELAQLADPGRSTTS